MKKRQAAIAVGAVALALLALGLAAWLFPLFHAAFLLQDAWGAGGFQYGFSVELDEKNLSGQQKQIAQSAAWLFGGNGSSGMDWEINGRVADGLAYGKVYCKGSKNPVTELYAEKSEALINVEMPYQSIRENLASQYPMLGDFLPEWDYGTYLSSAQAEELFQVDLQELFRGGELAESHVPSFWESLRILMGMKRKKGEHGGRQFETEIGDYLVLLEIVKEEGTPVLGFAVTDQTGRKAAVRYVGKITFQEPGEIVVPDSVIEDKDVQQFAELLESFQRLEGMLKKAF